MKCRNCSKVATLHITEVSSDDQCEVLDFCEECGRRYLTEPQAESKKLPEPTTMEEVAALDPNPDPCEVCGIKFVEFRNTGRLGCSNDYDAFREELLPLLESIHGDTRHVGKVPRHRAISTRDLAALRKRLQQAIQTEDYELAAQLRDEIKQAEQGLT